MVIDRCILILLFLFLHLVESSFMFQDCGDDDRIIKMSEFSVSPDPVDMKLRTTNITVFGEITRDIPESALLQVKYYNIRKLFGMRLDFLIPCILGKYGSCTLPFCGYMDRFQSQACSFLSANGTICECPPRAGIYSVENAEVEIAETSAIGRFIAKGEYRTEMKLIEANTEKELACFKFYTELV